MTVYDFTIILYVAYSTYDNSFFFLSPNHATTTGFLNFNLVKLLRCSVLGGFLLHADWMSDINGFLKSSLLLNYRLIYKILSIFVILCLFMRNYKASLTVYTIYSYCNIDEYVLNIIKINRLPWLFRLFLISKKWKRTILLKI